MILLRIVSVGNFEFSYSICDISLNDSMPNPPRFGGRVNNLPSVEHTTPPLMTGQDSFVIRLLIIFIILLIFGRICVKLVNAACSSDFAI